MQIIKQNQVQEKIITIRDQQVIIDSDVAELYSVETKRINEAVSRNQDKFPNGYLFKLNKQNPSACINAVSAIPCAVLPQPISPLIITDFSS